MRFGRTSAAGVNLGDNPVLSWQKKMRKIFFIVIAAMVIWIFVQIGKYRIAEENDSMKGTFAPDTSVIYDRFFDWHSGIVPFFGIKNRSILHENIIIFLKRDLEIEDVDTGQKSRGNYYGISRVIGLPGDTIKYLSGEIIVGMKDGDKVANKRFPAPHGRGITETEEIPPDRFFILNDNIGSSIQDSRHFGYIRGDEIKGKVLVALKIW